MRSVIAVLALSGSCLVGCGERVEAARDGGDASTPMSDVGADRFDGAHDAGDEPAMDASDARPLDAPTQNRCESAGGRCVPAMRSSSPPGFAFMCPEGFVSPNGTSSWIGPGSELLNNGCPVGGGFEAAPSGCCSPARDE